jgi:hypothetical protein
MYRTFANTTSSVDLSRTGQQMTTEYKAQRDVSIAND